MNWLICDCYIIVYIACLNDALGSERLPSGGCLQKKCSRREQLSTCIILTVSVCNYICMYVCMYACMCVYIYIYVHIYTLYIYIHIISFVNYRKPLEAKCCWSKGGRVEGEQGASAPWTGSNSSMQHNTPDHTYIYVYIYIYITCHVAYNMYNMSYE